MRALRLLLVVAVVAAAASVADVLVRSGVQTAIAERIERQSPGSHATVSIPDFPFLGHLVAGGDVPEIDAVVTNVAAGRLRLDRVDLRLLGLHVSRSALLSGHVEATALRSGTVVAEVSQASVRRQTGIPVQFGAGTIGTLGVGLPAHLSVSGDRVQVTVAGLVSFGVTVPVLDILPCVSSAAIVPGHLQLSCHLTRLPAVLEGARLSL